MPDRTRPRAVLAGISSRCTSRNVRLRFRVTDASRLRYVQVLVDGRQVRRTSKKTFSVFVRAARFRSGRHVVRVVAVDTAGNRRVVVRVFRRCARLVRRVPPRFTG